jgi:hypothetical protein
MSHGNSWMTTILTSLVV